ncbi:hypothetical protein [Oceanicoccus sp. KOV_DT_Chl]|uniref:hypothetical protein n=1 Tax=Oceanicoccus sp. KOV_DT_Chl TaxID=1904639 RepID=UPI000C7B504D|nr:hypothetical protein [Oceanicoccus sp. KOV_DT_Chl]
MWPAFVIALFAGFLIGYLFRKVFFRDAIVIKQLDRELTEASEALEQARSTQKLLEQENADLKYQLGEEKKSRAYAESKYDQSQDPN